MNDELLIFPLPSTEREDQARTRTGLRRWKAMNEDDVIRIGKRYYESLFPKNCPNCQRQFQTLREYLLVTTRLGHAHSYDAELGNWKTEDPIGTLMCTKCPCGTTLALSTEHMMLPQRLALLDWLREETQRQGISSSELLEGLRDKVRQLVLAEPAKDDPTT